MQQHFGQLSNKFSMEVSASKAGVGKPDPLHQTLFTSFFFFFFKLSCIGTEPHSCFYILSVAVFASRQGWLIMTENMSCKVLNIYYLAFYKGSLPTPDLKQRWNSEVQFQNSAETILLLSWYPRSCQINGEKWPAWCRKADKPARTISL